MGRTSLPVFFGSTPYTFSTIDNSVRFTVGPVRKPLASKTTIFAVAYSTFGASTNSAFGRLIARRRR